MAGQSGGLVGAWIAVLTLVGAGCGYDNGSNPTGPGYGDTTARIAPAAAVGRSDFRVFTATGDIAPTLAEFRAALGDPLNGGTPGPLAAGRREIKWDGAPELMPGDFFNTTVKASAEITCGSNAGPPAATRGFGLVFSDVERVGAASIKLFDAQGGSLGQYHAPVRSDAAGFSFVGVVFGSPLIAEVRITSGQHALGADVQDLSHGGNRDLVVMDDYLYAEPQALP